MARYLLLRFRWHSGLTTLVDDITDAGHYLSVYAAMIKAVKSRMMSSMIIDCVAMERGPTETDGPYVKVGDRLTEPSDVAHIVDWRKPGAFLWGTLSGGCTRISTEPSTPH
jgi:hypothetical protein